MDQEWLNERETRAWIAFQRMRIEVNEVLARRLARGFGLTEADFVVLLRLSNSPERRLRARDMAAALHAEAGLAIHPALGELRSYESTRLPAVACGRRECR